MYSSLFGKNVVVLLAIQVLNFPHQGNIVMTNHISYCMLDFWANSIPNILLIGDY